ncbi:MAG: hypothetical protein JO247_09150, partial [Chloroflexi bacterium]|nr:hypothetical protein [Chloroflexota bacterium]
MYAVEEIVREQGTTRSALYTECAPGPLSPKCRHPAGLIGLADESVVLVSQVASLAKADLEFFMGRLPERWMALVNAGLRTGL